jgi:hypothetical protein
MMQRNSKMWLGWNLGILALALGLVACGRLNASDALTALQIVQVQKLAGSDCTVPAAATAAHRTAGTLDLALPDASAPTFILPPYYLPVLVANNLSAVGGSTAEEMNNVTLQHFTIELSAPNVAWSSACPSTFDTTTITELIRPGGTVGASFNIITPSHSRCILPYVPAERMLVTAKITAKGRHGGTSIESAPFIYTIEVCTGCLQTDYVDPSLVAYRYPADYPLCAALTGSNPYSGDACLPPGQDQTILCCGLTTTVAGVSQNVALCPGVFTGSTSTATTTAAGP